jgi:hypothetical protein
MINETEPLPNLPDEMWDKIINHAYQTPLNMLSKLSFYDLAGLEFRFKSLLRDKRDMYICDLKAHKNSIIKFNMRDYPSKDIKSYIGVICHFNTASFCVLGRTKKEGHIGYYGEYVVSKKTNENDIVITSREYFAYSQIIDYEILYDTETEERKRELVNYEMGDKVYYCEKYSWNDPQSIKTEIVGVTDCGFRLKKPEKGEYDTDKAHHGFWCSWKIKKVNMIKME